MTDLDYVIIDAMIWFYSNTLDIKSKITSERSKMVVLEELARVYTARAELLSRVHEHYYDWLNMKSSLRWIRFYVHYDPTLQAINIMHGTI